MMVNEYIQDFSCRPSVLGGLRFKLLCYHHRHPRRDKFPGIVWVQDPDTPRRNSNVLN